MLQILKNTRIDFVGLRYWGYGFSLITFVISVVLLSLGYLKPGVDFAGGHLVQVRALNAGIGIGQVRAALSTAGITDAEVQTYGSRDEFLIRVPLSEEAGASKGAGVEQALTAAFPGAHEVVRTEDVGPKIGAELSRNAVRAVLWSLALILLYVSWRFELRFAVGAVLSLAHDVTICLGFLALTGRQTSLSVVAALLTIVGYSLNDTIVVCDRIREELRLRRREPLPVIINSSINLTLSRTFITGLSAIVVLIVLSIFGGKVINDFAVTLLFGTILGTYSSIFIASPVVLEWDRLTSRFRKAKRAEG